MMLYFVVMFGLVRGSVPSCEPGCCGLLTPPRFGKFGSGNPYDCAASAPTNCIFDVEYDIISIFFVSYIVKLYTVNYFSFVSAHESELVKLRHRSFSQTLRNTTKDKDLQEYVPGWCICHMTQI